MRHKGVNVPFQRYRWVFVTEDFREGFYVHSALDGTRCKGVTESMETVVGHLLFFKEQFKATLIGTNRDNLRSVRYDVF